VKALAGVLTAGLLLGASVARGNATIVIVNADAPGAGFNDPRPVAPVGGNPGTTLGSQRLAVFQEAARIWGAALDSPVPITVLSHFEALTCDNTGAVLGSAGPTNIFASDDPTLPAGVSPSVFPRQHTWYVSAESEMFARQAFLSGTGTDPANYDIEARFNSTLDDPTATNCHGFVWYYGLDNQHGNSIDLLTTVLHEFGHGLGFISLTDPGTGEFTQGEPDAWSYVLFDESTGKHWSELDAGQRMASAVSGALAWDGPAVKAAVPTTLGIAPLVRVTSAPQTPSVVKDYKDVTVAQFSEPISGAGVSGPLGVGSTGFGCTGQGRLASLNGQIAILDRGGPQPDAGCTFVEKARNAQDAGAIALLVANNTTGLITPSGTAADVVIPVLMMTQVDGQALKSAVSAGPVNASILRDPSQGYQGADTAQRAFMYAPSPLSGGSSVSHWDTSAFPNLLMEPNINPDLTHTLDLTPTALLDIGWRLGDGGIAGGIDAGVPDAGTGGGGGGGGKSGCSASSGPPSPWLALLGLLVFVRRRRPA
jgi:MYXO-CTERM domain-containing protein